MDIHAHNIDIDIYIIIILYIYYKNIIQYVLYIYNNLYISSSISGPPSSQDLAIARSQAEQLKQRTEDLAAIPFFPQRRGVDLGKPLVFFFFAGGVVFVCS